MSRRLAASVLVAFATLMLLSGAVAEAALSPHRFQTGFLDDPTFTGSSAATGFQRAAEAGATIERLRIDWAAVAPVRPANPTDPNDPAYRWSEFDAEVAAALAAGQQPIANILDAPSWASSGGTYPASYPDPAQFADFAYAAAQHYDGLHGSRITFWEIFNEPNIGLYLDPQFVDGQPESAIWYRDILNRAVPMIKSVHADNFIVAGSTAPYYDTTPSTRAVNPAWGPLGFLRAVLCLTPQLTVDKSMPGCPAPVPFDAWSHHPYSEGGPTHQATLPDEVVVGDLPKLKQVLDAGWSNNEISAAAAPEIWATEFSWNANPPDPGGVPTSLLERWIPEAMHGMWSNGVTVLTWFLLVDSASPYRTGFYPSQAAMLASQPKAQALLEAYRFPFVAYPAAGGITFWGRTPAGAQGTVAVEQDDGAGGWTTLGQVASDGDGIFQGSFPTSSQRDVRAQLIVGGEASVPFSLTPVPDQFFPSFGVYQFDPPQTTLDSAPSGTVSSQSASFAFSSLAASRFECSLDGGAFTGCASPVGYDGLTAGTHSFAVRGVGLGGITDPSPATASWTVAATQPSPPGGGNSGGGGGGGGGGLAADLSVDGSVSAPTASAGDTLTWTVRVLDVNLGPAVDAYVDLQLSNNLAFVSSSTTRGPGCTYSAPKLHCFLDWMSGDASSATITVTSTVASTGDYSVTATVGQLIPDSNTSNNTVVLKASEPRASPPPPPPPPQPAKPKPIIGKTFTTSTKPLAGKRLTVTFRVTRSDTGKPLMAGKMIADPFVNGKVIRHSESFRDGYAKLVFTVPKSARGKLLKLRLTIRYNGQQASRTANLRVR